jgi:mycothiol synthase
MTEEDFDKQMLHMEGIFPEGIFFIVNDRDEAIGTATGVLKLEPAMGYLHMVSVDPAYRGRGLARPVNAAVLKYLVEHGCENITLHTDDFRIPAIKVYLGLGFRPIIYEDDMVDRWQKILKVLGIEEIDTYTAECRTGPIVKAAL